VPDVLLLNAPRYIPTAGPPLENRSDECLGLAYLAAVLRRQGISVSILDAAIERWDARETVRQVMRRKFSILGVSLFYSRSQIEANVSMISELRRRLPSRVHMCVGGYVATFSCQDLLEECGVDSIARGEGEQTFLTLVQRLLAGRDWHDLSGLAWRRHDGEMMLTEPQRLIDDLDSLPFPARDYLQKSLTQGCAPNIATSRGCFGACSFCSISEFYRRSRGKRWRGRSPDNIAAEMYEVSQRFEVDRPFSIVDDEFIGPDPRRGLEIARAIQRLDRPIRFFVYARADTVREDVFRELKQAGLVAVSIGIESFVPRTLKLLNKRVTQEQCIEAIRTLRRLGISTRVGYIMFDPYTTIEELKLSLRLLKETGVYNTKVSDGLTNAVGLFKGTPLHQRFEVEDRISRRSYLSYLSMYEFAHPEVEAFRQTVRDYESVMLQTYLDELRRHTGAGEAERRVESLKGAGSSGEAGTAGGGGKPCGMLPAARFIKQSLLRFFEDALVVADRATSPTEVERQLKHFLDERTRETTGMLAGLVRDESAPIAGEGEH